MRRVALLLAVLLVALPPRSVSTQSSALTIVSASPTGEIAQLSDANEIHVVFSEPMVALGRIPDNPTPPWIQIAPAIAGAFRWSGTSILIFTPDAKTKLPNATRYTVTIDASATSATGHALGTAYRFTFTTPTVKLLSARWARQSARFDSQVALALQFNQTVRPADVLAHVTIRYERHDWTAPAFSAAERARLLKDDPDGLRRFDEKVAATRAVTQSTAAVAVRLAADWDRKRFPASGSLVVVETTSPPPPESWLRITIDARMPSPDGAAVPVRVQTSAAELDHAFFATALRCRTECQPSNFNAVTFSIPVPTDAFVRAISVRDITIANEAVVTQKARPSTSGARDTAQEASLEAAGFERQPAMSSWLLRLDPAMTSADGQTLGYPWIGIIQTSHDRAFTSFGDGHGVWEKDGGPQLPFSSKNFRSVLEWLTPIQPGDLMTQLRALQKKDFDDKPAGPGTARTLGVTPDLVQAHGFDLSPALSKNGTGLAWAAVAPGETIPGSKPAGQSTNSTVVQVTNLGVTVKDSPTSTLLFVTRLDNGQPVADAKVSLVNLDNKPLWTGQTNRDGIAMAPALSLRDPKVSGAVENERWGSFQFIAIAEKDGDLAYVGSDWNEGIEPWEFGMGYDQRSVDALLRGSVFTDRGVYKPGEEVHFKTIVRADSASGIALLPAGTLMDVVVKDNRNRTLDSRGVKLNKYSAADWSWTVPADGSVGDYSVTVAMHGLKPPAINDMNSEGDRQYDRLKRIDATFLVAAYRRPDFRVGTTLAVAAPVTGESMHATVDGRYLFGNGMAKRPVRWTLDRDPDWTVPSAIRDLETWKTFTFGYFPRGARANDRRVSGDTAPLDATGKLALDLPTPKGADLAYRYTFSGEVEDVSRQRIANQSSVVVYPAPWMIGLHVPDYFADTSKGTHVDVVAVDLTGRAVAGVTVRLSLTRVQFNSVRRAEGSGFYQWDTERVDVPAGEWTIQTTSGPLTQTIPVPEGGEYQLTALATDALGHTTRTDTSFYGLGPGYTAWQRFDHNRIELKPEHDTWKPGETARVMIQSPWESAIGLLTVEREGIRTAKRFALTSTQQTVEVPIGEGDIPNVYVSVLLIRGRTSKDFGADGSDPGKPAFRLGYAQLKVEDASKKLGVAVKADRDEYRPANTAKVSVAVTDAAGKGAKSEVTLWAVDYGVLSLTGYEPPDILHAVYQEKPLEVMTVDSRQRIVSRRVLTPKGAGDGGGGGGDAGAGALRKDFRPLAFWLGSIETNGGGTATAEVKLPDSLTTYHIMAVADDEKSRFGATHTEIRVSKPLTLVPAFPRFLTIGDRASFGGTVTNTLGTGGSAIVTIKSLDPDLLSIATASQTIALGAHLTEAVRFDAVAKTTGTARVQMTATLGGNSDAFETTLPVSVMAPIETQATFGEVTGRGVEHVVVPAGAIPQLGGLHVDLASTALVGLGEGVRYVTEYPFGCAEQRASRALVLLLAADLGHAFSMTAIKPAEYHAQAASLLNSLESFQCPSGGFTLWPGQCMATNAYLTAYVLHVMKIGGAQGIAPSDAITKPALDYLEQSYRQPAPAQMQWQPVWGASMAFGVKVLAEYGRNEDANLTRLMQIAARLPVFSLSYLADALAAGKDRGPRYQDVIRRLTNALRVEGDQAHVEEIDPSLLSWVWDTNASGTAVVLDGFVQRGDDPVFIQRMVRWLLAARKNGRWDNTHENARALESLVSYYRKFESDVPDMTATITLGSKALGTLTFKGRSTTAQTVQLAMRDLIATAGTSAPADVVFTQAGTGHLFYTTRLQFARGDAPPAVDRGVKVERRYETYVEKGDGMPGTTFNAGDLVRVTLTITVPAERRYVAVTDPLPAGFEAVDGWFRTTAADIAKASTASSDDQPANWIDWLRRGGFDRTEKYDDRVVLFATRLGEGRHEFSYLVRATTSGSFGAAGTWAEEMYAPEVNGRAGAATITIK
jgi:uncharacterized protein YfaS (alpha-2-macroglobulin family)